MPKGIPSNQRLCCGCNGPSAKCKGCKCAKAGAPCVNCRAPECNNSVHIGPQTVCLTSAAEPVGRVADLNPLTDSGSTRTTDNPIVDNLHDPVDRQSLSLQAIYDVVIQWRPSAMRLPRCAASNEFVEMLASLYQIAAEADNHDMFALKKATILSRCVLQRLPSRKVSEIRKALERRIRLWKNGRFVDVFNEARILQRRCMPMRSSPRTDDWIKRYVKLVTSGKLSAATAILEENQQSSILDPDSIVDGLTVREHLQNLHPTAADADASALLQRDLPNVREHHPSLFSVIDGEAIIRAANKTSGGAGPSGLDAMAWRQLLNSFSVHSKALADALANFAVSLSTIQLSPRMLEAFTACRLISIPKNNGKIRPIGVSEVVRRIVSKTILSCVKDDLQDVAGIVQLCASQRNGIDFAIHSLRDTYSSNQSYGLLAVDAKNAFNSVNRNVMLHNIKHTCPGLAQSLSNIYAGDAELVLGGGSLASCEGVTQGDPLAMAAFAMASLPLISMIKQVVPNIVQRWFADDANFVGLPEDLLRVWQLLQIQGPKFGYNVNPSKTKMLLHPQSEGVYPLPADIETRFDGIEVLGAPIGSGEFVKEITKIKILKWTELVSRISTVSRFDPHAAFSGFNKSIQWKWTHFMRSTPSETDLYLSLRDTIFSGLAPSLFDQDLNSVMHALISSPISKGGMGIVDPVSAALTEFESSKKFCKTFDSGLQGDLLRDAQNNLTKELNRERQKVVDERLAYIRSILPASMHQALEFALGQGASSWISAVPVKAEFSHLCPHEFRDALALRYGFDPIGIPKDKCVCGDDAKLPHLLSCKRGGVVITRHNALRDFLATEISQVCTGVGVEPILQRVDSDHCFDHRVTCRSDDARLDIVCIGLSDARYERTFFDVTVFNHFAPSCASTRKAAFDFHEARKRSKYAERIIDIERSRFMPLVFTASGAAGPDAMVLLRTIARLRSSRGNKSYAECLCGLRRSISLLLCRAASHAIRGCRSTRGHPYSRGSERMDDSNVLE